MGSLGRLVAGIAVLASACTGASSATRVVRTPADAAAAVGERVRVTGTLYREKLGDSVENEDLRVICLDPRLDPELLGKSVTVEGILEQTSHEAERNPMGEISQGTAEGVQLWTIATCTLIRE